MNGATLLARELERRGVEFVFTLCGGHISPILVESKKLGIRVVDVRHEATAVFAADAVARITGVPGVAAVTAGPGVTNTITALKNAQMAQSPVVLLGGATATVLKGRGSLQDIDQMALVAPHVKWAGAARQVRQLPDLLAEAFYQASSGVPGPVFLECPVDLLYDQEVVRSFYGAGGKGGGLGGAAVRWYLRRHLKGVFKGSAEVGEAPMVHAEIPRVEVEVVEKAAKRIGKAKRPVLVIGSQALLDAKRVKELVSAVESLEVPVYLSGMARGLLGRDHPLQRRHKRRNALGEADLVLLAGVPCDFRLDYGRHIGRATLISVNRDREALKKNRKPWLGIEADPADFLIALAGIFPARDRGRWLAKLAEREAARNEEIEQQSTEPTDHVNPIALFRELEATLPDSSALVADGGDFVATASYVLQPRSPLSWLDPGVFGTLGVGAGFALGAKLCRPEDEVWLLWGDGSAGYGLVEMDTFVRHEIPVIAIVGNDAGWTQIAREQVEILEDDIGTVLLPTDYHRVAEGFGAAGLLLDDPEKIDEVFAQARELAAEGRPVLINARIGSTDFRKGSISM